MSTAEPLTPSAAAPRRNPAPRRWSPAEFRRMRDLGILNGHAVELVDGAVFDRDAGRPFAFTQDEFCKLWDANFFYEQRVQLIGGEILEESPMNPPHYHGVRKTTRVLERIFTAGYDVRPQGPLDLSPISRPHPDVAVVVGALEDYADRLPTAAVLVVEVSDSTITEDTTTKAEMYATGGIADYWVLDVDNRQLHVFRNPQPIPDGGKAYRTHDTFGPGETVAPLVSPGTAVKVDELLP